MTGSKAGTRVLLAGGAVTVALLLPQASAQTPPTAWVRSDTNIALPDPTTDWAYQIGGSSVPAASVGIVDRDRHDTPAGRYDICYVNAFQTQPDERRTWTSPRHRDLVLRDGAGRRVVDEVWGEWLLDTRTAAKRTRLAAIIGRWIDGCARHGFEAVEPDNLDTWSRSSGLVHPADNLALARLLARRAHAVGLAIAQKNAAGLGARGARAGFDFAIAEECGHFSECGRYVKTYGDEVLVVEYVRSDFVATCAAFGDRLPVLLRDRDVSTSGTDERC